MQSPHSLRSGFDLRQMEDAVGEDAVEELVKVHCPGVGVGTGTKSFFSIKNDTIHFFTRELSHIY